jgi:murein DD-endopeptidase MepM/ murein hydrolase activator NlpD
MAPDPSTQGTGTAEAKTNSHYIITGEVKPEDSFEAIFEKYNLDKLALADIHESAKGIFNLSKIAVGDLYALNLDKDDHTVQSLQYGIDDTSFLNVVRMPDGFVAEKVDLQIDRKIGSLYVNIKGSLMQSMPSGHSEYVRLALKLSDIYAWDIDFSSDIRNGDAVKIIVEELWVGEVFKGFGDILAAEIINNGEIHPAYRFEHNGETDYYDADGKSLRKALLKSPLKFKYISSRFTKRRLHPKLRVYRPHLGVDYVASTGTPVSAAGSGTVIFAGYKGQNGKMVKIKHNNGYITYYGHLSKIPKKIRKSAKVSQGDIIGYVGSTGLATGPHLDYRIKSKGKFIDPLKLRLPRGTSVPKQMMAAFRQVVGTFDSRLASLMQPIAALDSRKKTSG